MTISRGQYIFLAVFLNSPIKHNQAMNFFGRQPSNNINRPPSEKEENLIMELRKLASSDVEILLLDSQPSQLKLFNTTFLETPDQGQLTNEELTLLQLTRFMKFGTLCTHVENGQWDGNLNPQTHITVKL